MSMQEALALFERAADARGKLLRAEADRAGATVGALLLTFDVGRILVTPSDDQQGKGLGIRAISDPSEAPAGLGGLEEEEPWWRLLGAPLSAAWPGGVEEGVGASGLGSLMVLKLRFREEDDNPRIVQLEAAGKAIRISLLDPVVGGGADSA